ncbi:MAG: CAP domain-containing protein [Pseudomonadota bacterium]
MKPIFAALGALAIAPLIAGCSMGSQNVSLGFNDDSTAPSAAARRSSGPLFSRGFEPKAGAPKPKVADSRTRVAALDDRAKPGSFAKAPRGALADRDYSNTRLSPAAALTLINDYRRTKGLRGLKLHPQLTRAAKMHSRDLARWDRISHYGSDGSNPWDRVKRTGFRARLAAENVGTGQKDLREVFEGWKQSPGHNKNLLLADATHMGIALVDDPKTEFKTFWTLVLGTPM